MYTFSTLASLALLLASRAHASVYVTNPVQSTTCTGGGTCDVSWVDNGESPLLSDIGLCDVALYTGELVLAQSLPSVDVSTTGSFTFTVDPAAGADGQYYIVFTSEGISYQGFSASFTLTGMSGTTPSGGSSAPVSGSPTTTAGSSTPAGSTTPTGTDTATAPSGTSTPVAGTTTPTGSTPVDTTAATGTPSDVSASAITPASGTPTATTPTTTTATTTRASTTTTASGTATATNAAGRAGSSTSLGGVAALLALSGVLAF